MRKTKKRGLKLFFLQARCGIIANLFEDIASMVNGKQKGKGTICELCTSSLCLMAQYCAQFSLFYEGLKKTPRRYQRKLQEWQMAGMTWVKTIDFEVGLTQESRVEENL